MFIAASVAGSTMFVGFEKPWRNELPLYTAITCRALIDLVKTVTPEQLQAYGWRPEDMKPGWTPPTVLPDADYRALIEGASGEGLTADPVSGAADHPLVPIRPIPRVQFDGLSWGSSSPIPRSTARANPRCRSGRAFR